VTARAVLTAAVTAVILVAALVALRRRGDVQRGNDVQQEMAKLSAEAIQMALAEHRAPLDYSVESVQRVEAILGSLYDRPSKDALTLERRRYVAVRYGAYVGEVIRRKWGGHWEQDHSVAGPGSFPIKSQGHESFPIAWCFKRLTNGPEDNVWDKLQILYVKDGRGTPGTEPRGTAATQ
jgi:hypothetical protein